MIVHLHKQVEAVVIPFAQFDANVVQNQKASQVFDSTRGRSSDAGESPRVAKRSGPLCTASSLSSGNTSVDVVPTARKRRRISPPTQTLHCPLQRCKFSTTSGIPDMCNHIHYYHDYKFPKYDPEKPIYGIQITGHGHIDLTNKHKTILPGMSLQALYNEKGVEILPATDLDRNEAAINDEVMTGLRFYCPYEDCECQCGERGYIFSHIRSVHDARFPKIQANRKFAVKDVRGEIVKFDGNDRVPRNQRITVEYDFLDTQNRYFCPYERCNATIKDRTSMFQHIRCNHDPDFPRLGTTRQPFTLQTASGEEVPLSYEFQQKIPEGEKINLVYETTDQDNNRWYCPYRSCQSSSYSIECRLFRHIRQKHQSDFPYAKPNQPPREVQTLTGKTVDFSGDPRKMLDSHERLTIIYGTYEYNALYKFRCPYKGCPTLGKERSRIYRHIREVHTPDFPPISTRRGTHICRCARTKRGIILNRGEEPFMENGDPVEIVYIKELETLDLFYCPFRDCTAGCYRRKAYVLKHIRQEHDPCFVLRASRNPPTIYIGPPERRRIIDFTALFRGTVDPDEKLAWE